jgi:hypothetical protein
MNKVYDELKELNPEALIVEDFEQAYLGYTHDGKAIYDYYTMVDIVVDGILEDNDFDEEEAVSEAIQHVEKNIVNAYLGINTPIFMFKEIHD